MDAILKTLEFLHQEGSSEYQERIPVATRDNIKEVGNAIMSYEVMTNEFLANLINKIALTEVLTNRPDSVFGEFIGQDLLVGNTIESIFVKVGKGEVFPGDTLEDGDSIDQFKVKKPGVEVAYHRVDRKLVYTITVQEDNLKNTFQNTGAFREFVNGVIDSLQAAVDRDLYVDGLELLDRDGTDGKSEIYGKYYNLGQTADPKVLATALMEAIKSATTYMPFTRSEFNTLGVETSTPKSRMVLFLRADMKDLIDVHLLANTYNMGKLEADIKVKLIDEFIDGEQVAAILDSRHIKINHSVRKTTSATNHLGLYTNYFSHVHRLVSYNPFANAVKITGKLVE